MPIASSLWTKVRTEKLKALWALQLFTAAQIGCALGGISRCAVLGKARRMNLAPHKNASPRPQRSPPDAPIVPQVIPSTPEPEIAPLPLPVPFLGLLLLELGPEDCRYPEGERVPYLFCGQSAMKGSAYCACHHGIVYHPATPRRRVF